MHIHNLNHIIRNDINTFTGDMTFIDVGTNHPRVTQLIKKNTYPCAIKWLTTRELVIRLNL